MMVDFLRFSVVVSEASLILMAGDGETSRSMSAESLLSRALSVIGLLWPTVKMLHLRFFC